MKMETLFEIMRNASVSPLSVRLDLLKSWIYQGSEKVENGQWKVPDEVELVKAEGNSYSTFLRREPSLEMMLRFRLFSTALLVGYHLTAAHRQRSKTLMASWITGTRISKTHPGFQTRSNSDYQVANQKDVRGSAKAHCSLCRPIHTAGIGRNSEYKAVKINTVSDVFRTLLQTEGQSP